MIPVSAEEIKEFWYDFCERKGVVEAARAAGEKRIDEDPDFWADHTMFELLDAVSSARRGS